MPFSISATFHITMALCDYYRGCKLSLNCRWTWSISSFGGLKVVALKAEGLRCWPKTSASLLLWAVGDPLLHVSPHLSLFPYFILALCSLTVKGFETCPQRWSPHVFLLYPHACKWCLCAMEMCQNRLFLFWYFFLHEVCLDLLHRNGSTNCQYCIEFVWISLSVFY